jgi:hypothetical protein
MVYVCCDCAKRPMLSVLMAAHNGVATLPTGCLLHVGIAPRGWKLREARVICSLAS